MHTSLLLSLAAFIVVASVSLGVPALAGAATFSNSREGKITAWLRGPRRRREADALLRSSAGRWEHHPAVAWRAAELTSPCERQTLARSLRSVVSEVRDPRTRFSTSILNRQLGRHAWEFESLAERIADLHRPVGGAGMLLIRDLLTNGCGPLYIGGDVDELSPAITQIHDLLEVD